jgi:hypothetical protein
MKPICHLYILAITLRLHSALKNIIDILQLILFTLLPIKPSHRLAYKDPLGNTNLTLSGDPLASTQLEMITTCHVPTLSLPSHLVSLFLSSQILHHGTSNHPVSQLLPPSPIFINVTLLQYAELALSPICPPYPTLTTPSGLMVAF